MGEPNIRNRMQERKNKENKIKCVLIPAESSHSGIESFSVQRLRIWAEYMFKTFEYLNNELYQRDLVSFIVYFLRKY